MSNKYKAALITSILGVGFIICYVSFDANRSIQYGILDVAIVMFFELLVMLVAGIFLICFKNTKQSGYGVLLGTAITLVIGFGICTSA